VAFKQHKELIAEASAAGLLAYEPSSGFQVGAALVTKAGRLQGILEGPRDV
jgi:cytidine deaminase